MHNVNSWLKQHWKTITAYAVGITVGMLLALFSNTIRQDTTYQAVTQPINNSWIFISIVFAIMAAMIITGFIMGKMYEKEKDELI